MSTYSPNNGAARTFYGDPQHETGSYSDPERLGLTAPSRQSESERALYGYAHRASADRGRSAGVRSADAQAT
ncbi:hypothetical protein ELS19_13625 [Halogeometricum borinquense]|uniref:Uncharacterized protein n=1 Tax=Halogeometricum borinquense TaxID=60847 RepID=A0A482TLX1_9EURY|nr:hypothetical protein [Halogeometricum borinquense]RYJ14893.1 hypothetical protein ELS19_13625 [Halogeometricum borinquense]